jgi:hypothetical protein
MAGRIRLVSESSNRSGTSLCRLLQSVKNNSGSLRTPQGAFFAGQRRLSTILAASLGETYRAADAIYGRRKNQPFVKRRNVSPRYCSSRKAGAINVGVGVIAEL